MDYKAFTLAEVLITLGIIGIVAAITLPALIGKYKEKETVTAVKVSYTIFSQALLRLANDYGSMSAIAPNSWEEGDDNAALKENANITIRALSKYLKAFRTCDSNNDCMADNYKTLDGSKTYNWDKYSNLQTGILANGVSFWILNNCGNENSEPNKACGQIGFDINGRKKPNILGHDFFWFAIRNNGQIAITKSEEEIKLQCSLTSKKEYNGYKCSSYIMIYENMDYLKGN